MLLPFLLKTPAPVFVATQVQAYGLYAGNIAYPGSDSSFRTGTQVIVRRTEADGTVVTDLRTLAVEGQSMRLRIVSSGKIVRNAKGEVQHIEVRARPAEPRAANEGMGVWDLPPDKGDVLKGWSESSWDARHPVELKDDGFYALGAIEAITFSPDVSAWRVPAPSDTHVVSLGLERSTGPYSEYTMGEGTLGRFWYENREMALRVRPVFLKGDRPSQASINGRKFVAHHAAVALFDETGQLVGFGYMMGKSDDLDSQEWGGKTGGLSSPPGFPTAPNPFASYFIMSFAAPVTLSPTEAAAVLRSL